MRLALLIGVGKYLGPGLDPLDGPLNDLSLIRSMLSGEGGYGFPSENICVLTDEDATYAKVEEAFKKALLDRITNKDDVVVIFFAGHGSQTPDDNHDEADNMDETLVLHDSRTNGQGDFIDDHVNAWLKRLNERTQNVTLILDSCNSGSAARSGSGFKARRVKPAIGAAIPIREGDATDWIPDLLPGLTVLSAATDGTSALEENGAGFFTQALVEVLSGSSALTYAQLAMRVPPLLRAAGTPQIAYVQGDLESFVFQSTSRKAPVSFRIRSVLPGSGSAPVRIELSGTTLPGMGSGAELRIYDGVVQGPDLTDPAKAKGRALVRSATGLNANATVSQPPGAAPIVEGDVAVLARPSDSYEPLTVTLRSSGLEGGVPSDLAAKLREAISSDGRTKGVVKVSDKGEFELSLDGSGSLILMGPASDIRNVIRVSPNDRWIGDLVRTLASHARQRVFLHMIGEGGADFEDQKTLSVQIVPADRQTPCAAGAWKQAPANREQTIPECYETHVKVRVDPASPYDLLVGGLVLSSDGTIFGFPSDGRLELVQPGTSLEFRAGPERMRAISPFDVQDHVMVFGTQKTNPVDWSALLDPAGRAPRGVVGTLHRTLVRFTDSHTRGQMTVMNGDDTTWTMTSVPLRVIRRPGSPGGEASCNPQICTAQ